MSNLAVTQTLGKGAFCVIHEPAAAAAALVPAGKAAEAQRAAEAQPGPAADRAAGGGAGVGVGAPTAHRPESIPHPGIFGPIAHSMDKLSCTTRRILVGTVLETV